MDKRKALFIGSAVLAVIAFIIALCIEGAASFITGVISMVLAFVSGRNSEEPEVKEVPVEVIKEVEKEVIKEVPVEVIKEVIKEVPVEVIKEVPVIPEVPIPAEGGSVEIAVSAGEDCSKKASSKKTSKKKPSKKA